METTESGARVCGLGDTEALRPERGPVCEIRDMQGYSNSPSASLVRVKTNG